MAWSGQGWVRMVENGRGPGRGLGWMLHPGSRYTDMRGEMVFECEASEATSEATSEASGLGELPGLECRCGKAVSMLPASLRSQTVLWASPRNALKGVS
jgi:hypothetical protein